MSMHHDDPIMPHDESDDELLPDLNTTDNKAALKDERDLDDLVHSRRSATPPKGKPADPDDEVHSRPMPESPEPPADPDDAVHDGI